MDSKYKASHWYLRSSWNSDKVKEDSHGRKKQIDEFIKMKESEDINLIAQQMFGKEFTLLTYEQKKTARKTFIWGWSYTHRKLLD